MMTDWSHWIWYSGFDMLITYIKDEALELRKLTYGDMAFARICPRWCAWWGV